MQYCARVVDGIVAEIIAPVPDFPISERYHSDIVATLVVCAADVQQGWLYDGSTFVPPPPPSLSAADLLAYAADKRWRVETGGITAGGVPVATDDRSKTMIMGARIKADAEPDYTVGWKGADGSFVQLGSSQIIAISNAILAHVDACFAAEAVVAAAIGVGDITTTQQVDDWPWPA